MQKSETIGKLSKALTNVQKALKPALKDADNPFFKSKYADLNSVWDSARDLLSTNGLAVIQGNSVGLDNTVIVETILSHESGEWVQSELCLPLAKHDPQGVGSAVTYGRRYGLAAIVGIVADVDDDGNHASGRTNGTPRPQDNKSSGPSTMTKAQFKKRWESSDDGGGITYEDIANCAKEWGLFATPRTSPIDSVRAAVLKAANVSDGIEREGLAKGVQVICKALNESGDSITWSKTTTNEYVADLFGEGVTYENANEAQLKTLTDDLQARLKTLREGK